MPILTRTTTLHAGRLLDGLRDDEVFGFVAADPRSTGSQWDVRDVPATWSVFATMRFVPCDVKKEKKEKDQLINYFQNIRIATRML